MAYFDDARLDDRDALRAADWMLRRVATAGARVRVDAAAADSLAQRNDLDADRPRAVLAVGPEARLLRAVLEPSCPVPFLAWPTHSLPAWVGPLDLVIALAPAQADPAMIATVIESQRRGARLLVAAPRNSRLAEHLGSRVMLVSTAGGEPEPAALAVLVVLHELGLGPAVSPDRVAAALDAVAEECSPRIDLAQNPAKDLALGLADALPLVWGGSVLAARASRRVAEALREASGRAALAGEADDLLPVITATSPRDPFADPDEAADRRPALVILDDGDADPLVAHAEEQLRRTAEAADVRVCTLAAREGDPVQRYASLQARGMWAAAYLGVGLGRGPEPEAG